MFQDRITMKIIRVLCTGFSIRVQLEYYGHLKIPCSLFFGFIGLHSSLTLYMLIWPCWDCLIWRAWSMWLLWMVHWRKGVWECVYCGALRVHRRESIVGVLCLLLAVMLILSSLMNIIQETWVLFHTCVGLEYRHWPFDLLVSLCIWSQFL